MSPDSVFWLGKAWYTLRAISVKVRESLAKIPGDCTYVITYAYLPYPSTEKLPTPHLEIVLWSLLPLSITMRMRRGQLPRQLSRTVSHFSVLARETSTLHLLC